MSHFFYAYVSGCSKMEVQNNSLPKFKIIKLQIDAFSIFIFFKVLFQTIYESIFSSSNP